MKKVIIKSDMMDYPLLEKATTGQHIVYVKLAEDLEAMAKNIVKSLHEVKVRRINVAAFIATIIKNPVQCKNTNLGISKPS